MDFQRRRGSSPARRTLSPVGAGAAALAVGLLLSSCSDPPPPAPEPTGEEQERAWRLAVGSDPLDQTMAQIYAMAMNSHEAPTVVVHDDSQTAVALAAELATAPEATAQTDDPESDEVDDRYELVIARTMPLAETLDPEGYAELTAPGSPDGSDPADDREEFASLVEGQLTEAQLFEPITAVLGSGVHLTSITAEEFEVDGGEEDDLDQLAAACEDLVFGISEELPLAAELMDEAYDCVPQDIDTADEDTLVELLITAEIDAALFTTSHPGAADHALVSLDDVRSAFPEDQYAPVVSLRVADDVPDVVQEISAALDDEALLTIRRLVHGDDALEPEEAATYWLVEEGLLAEPENWG